MREKGISINTITYNAAIAALARSSTKKMREVVKQQMTSVYLRHDMEHGIIERGDEGDYVLEAYEEKLRFGSLLDTDEDQLWRKAMNLLDQMKKEGVAPDAISYSSAIIACGSAGRWKEALELIKIMQKGGPTTRPNRIAYTNAITACGRSGEYEHALRLFNDMKNDGLQPDRVSYNALISALKVAHQPDKVKGVQDFDFSVLVTACWLKADK